MAKHLLDRLAAALRPNARIGDCRGVLADGDEELRNIDERIAEAEARSIDPSVSDDDARKARDEAEDFRLYKRRLTRGLEDLRAVIAAKEDAQRSEERVTAYANVKGARDALVERWLGEGASAHAVLMRLIAETHANDQLIAQTNRMLPEGAARLRSAELEARGPINEVRWQSGDQFTRLTSLEWGRFDRPGHAWSLRAAEQFSAASLFSAEGERQAAATAAREARNTPEALAAKAAAEAERVKRYLVSQIRYCGGMITGVRCRDGVSGVDNEPVALWMDERQVRAAEQRGLNVELAPLKEKPRQEEGDFLHTLGREYADSEVQQL